jgi:hypothetical protein
VISMTFECPDHGFAADTSVNATVVCGCGRKAYPVRDGRRLHREELRRVKASQKPLQIGGSSSAISPVPSRKRRNEDLPADGSFNVREAA